MLDKRKSDACKSNDKINGKVDMKNLKNYLQSNPSAGITSDQLNKVL